MLGEEGKRVPEPLVQDLVGWVQLEPMTEGVRRARVVLHLVEREPFVVVPVRGRGLQRDQLLRVRQGLGVLVQAGVRHAPQPQELEGAGLQLHRLPDELQRLLVLPLCQRHLRLGPQLPPQLVAAPLGSRLLPAPAPEGLEREGCG